MQERRLARTSSFVRCDSDDEIDHGSLGIRPGVAELTNHPSAGKASNLPVVVLLSCYDENTVKKVTGK
jgi:hypothetical protein